jgi:hypothetical protein
LVTFHWLLTVAAVLAAAGAWLKARRLAKRLERLTESYWELRYEHGQLQSRVNRLAPDESAPTPAGAPPSLREGTVAFVPLSSLKR